MFNRVCVDFWLQELEVMARECSFHRSYLHAHLQRRWFSLFYSSHTEHLC